MDAYLPRSTVRSRLQNNLPYRLYNRLKLKFIKINSFYGLILNLHF